MQIKFGESGEEFSLADMFTKLGDPMDMMRAVVGMLEQQRSSGEFGRDYVETLIAAERVAEYATDEAASLRRHAANLDHESKRIAYLMKLIREEHKRSVKP